MVVEIKDMVGLDMGEDSWGLSKVAHRILLQRHVHHGLFNVYNCNNWRRCWLTEICQVCFYNAENI